MFACGMKHSSLYWMQASISTDIINVAANDPAQLWHRRLGHMSEKGHGCLIKKNVLPGLKNAKLERCPN